MATTRNTGGIIEPWSGSGWPLSLFVDQDALTEKGVYFCSRYECGPKNRRILRKAWQLACGHCLCKECLDFIQSLPVDQWECNSCKNEPFDDDARTLRAGEVVSIDHMDVDRQPQNGDADKQTRFDAIQLIASDKQQQQQEQQLEPRFCKIDCTSAMKDNRTNRELNKMSVKCPYECGTGSRLTIGNIEKHMSICKERLVPCEKCGEVIRYSQRSEHAANKCSLQAVDCSNRCGPEGLEYGDLPRQSLAKCLGAVNGQLGLSTATVGEEGAEGAAGAASEKGGEIDPDMAALVDSEDSSGGSNTSDEETVNFDAKEDLLCKVCVSKPVGAVLQTCGHMICRCCADIAAAAARAVEAARAMNAVARAVEAARAMNAALDDDVMAKCPICRKVVTGPFTANL